MLKSIILVAIVCTALLLTWCNLSSDDKLAPPTQREAVTPLENKAQRYHFAQPIMGTIFQISCYSVSETSARDAALAAFQLAREIEMVCSDYTTKSEINRVLNSTQAQPVSDTLAEVLGYALIIAKDTEGAFDPTIGHHSRNWRRAKAQQRLPDQAAIDKATALTGWQKISLSGNNILSRESSDLRVDLGGIAKGYAADKMLAEINRHGIRSAMITAGGDVRLGDAPPQTAGWKVGIKQDHSQASEASDYVILQNCAISTSGDLHQWIEIDGQRYSHILNPRTGIGLTRQVSATVIAPTAIQSDTLATTCCVSKDYASRILANKSQIKLLLLEESGHLQSTNFPTIHQQ